MAVALDTAGVRHPVGTVDTGAVDIAALLLLCLSLPLCPSPSFWYMRFLMDIRPLPSFLDLDLVFTLCGGGCAPGGQFLKNRIPCLQHLCWGFLKGGVRVFCNADPPPLFFASHPPCTAHLFILARLSIFWLLLKVARTQ